ncbi:HupE/UreJ family protein [Roseomonas sp. PWR1]|uniref:HupE/UreJ family protein n=1 Tax=Roseomonas nitratireducens TaxID=2820810 RepID=A0ABS4AXP5_9PROT|nr:HupE/UreJ family protein [Neoroseomonas nitratireducens]MBP0466165.1 HupE/UreJ family protein [Neoroseomonas nitratireducens]
MKRLAALLALAPLPALAHHPLGGTVPSSLWEGFASGVGHPMIGPDHLAFLLAAGVLAAALPASRGVLAILAFVAGGFLGSLAHVAGIGFGPVEALVALSLAAAGAALLAGAPAALLPAGFALAGLAHGHAFAEAIIGAEPTPLVAYLAALALTQAAIGIAAMLVARRLAAAGHGVATRRVAGFAGVALGVLFLGASLVG